MTYFTSYHSIYVQSFHFVEALNFLVVFEASHPLWPVARLDAAGSGPGTVRVV